MYCPSFALDSTRAALRNSALSSVVKFCNTLNFTYPAACSSPNAFTTSNPVFNRSSRYIVSNNANPSGLCVSPCVICNARSNGINSRRGILISFCHMPIARPASFHFHDSNVPCDLHENRLIPTNPSSYCDRQSSCPPGTFQSGSRIPASTSHTPQP